MRRRCGSTGVLSLLCIISLGLTLSADAHNVVNPRVLRIFDVTTAHGIVDRKPDRPTSVFAPDDNPIYVWFRAEGCTIGTTITSVWYYVDADSPIRISEGSVTVEVLDDWGQFNFELAPGRRWPIGEYRVELRVGDDLLAETTFEVVEKCRCSTSPRSIAALSRRTWDAVSIESTVGPGFVPTTRR